MVALSWSLILVGNTFIEDVQLCFVVGSTTVNRVLCPAISKLAKGCLRCNPSNLPPKINHLPSCCPKANACKPPTPSILMGVSWMSKGVFWDVAPMKKNKTKRIVNFKRYIYLYWILFVWITSNKVSLFYFLLNLCRNWDYFHMTFYYLFPHMIYHFYHCNLFRL